MLVGSHNHNHFTVFYVMVSFLGFQVNLRTCSSDPPSKDLLVSWHLLYIDVGLCSLCHFLSDLRGREDGSQRVVTEGVGHASVFGRQFRQTPFIHPSRATLVYYVDSLLLVYRPCSWYHHPVSSCLRFIYIEKYIVNFFFM